MQRINSWFILSTIFILLIILPNLSILYALFEPINETWVHIQTYLLADYIRTTIKISFFVGIFSILIGTSLAFLITVYTFPFRNFFKWAMILPLAIPPYIAAYTYGNMLSYTGNIQVFLRNVLGIQDSNWFIFDIMSEAGVIFIFTTFLFPYIYMIVYSHLQKEATSLIESARLLGRGTISIFFEVIIPSSRVVIIASVSLVLLEVLSDYGAVSYFGVQTLSTAIFTTWFNFSDETSALRLAAILLLAVFSIISLEKILRGRKKYTLSNTKIRPITRKETRGWVRFSILSYCIVVLSFGFFIPTLQLIQWSVYSYKEVLSTDFIQMMINSVGLALIASTIIMIMALIIANFSRISQGTCSLLYAKITLLGYSIPGTVIAISMVLFFNAIDRNMVWFYRLFDADSKTLLLSSSLVMLIFAYVVRFLGVGFQAIEGSFEKIGMKFYEASKTMGNTTTKTFFLIDIPMLKPAIIGGFSLVFVDISKELPLALLLRPFNFDTLATKVFVYANDELITRAAIPSLFIIGVAVIAIVFINQTIDKEDA